MNTRSYELFLAGAFLIVIFVVPVTQAVIELYQGALPQAMDVFFESPTEEHLRDYESDMEESSWIATRVRPQLRQFHFSAFHDPGSKVTKGRAGWLFYRPGVDYLIQSGLADRPQDTGPDAAVRAIVHFRDQLAGRGIQLLVVPVPGKASIYPDELTSRADRTSLSSRTLKVLAALQAAAVETVDLFEAFRRSRGSGAEPTQALYLTRDTHWSPNGVRAASETIARRIRQLGWLEPGTVSYARQEVWIERDGDIVRMMQLPDGQQRFAPEQVRCEQVVLTGNSTPYEDDPNSPVLFLGDSFARIYQTDQPGAAGVIAHLAHELKMPLASIVNDGGASTLVRQELGRHVELLDGKRLVVWQFVERDIRFGTEGWKEVRISPTRERGRTTEK